MPVPRPSSLPKADSDAGQAPPAKRAAVTPGNAAGDELTTFLRAISPPLSGLDAALAAARCSGVTMAHLRCAAEKMATRPEFAKSMVDFLGSSLGLQSAGDHFALMLALQSLS